MNLLIIVAIAWYCKIAYFSAIHEGYVMFRDTPKKFHDEILFVLSTIMLAPIAMTIRWIHKQWRWYDDTTKNNTPRVYSLGASKRTRLPRGRAKN